MRLSRRVLLGFVILLYVFCVIKYIKLFKIVLRQVVFISKEPAQLLLLLLLLVLTSVKSILELALLVFKSIYSLSLDKEYLSNRYYYILRYRRQIY